MDDAACMRALQRGDQSALETLYRNRHAELIDECRKIAFCVLGSAADAEDIAQDVWYRVVRSVDSWRDGYSVLGWLITIARNRIKDIGRKKARNPPAKNVGDDIWKIDGEEPERLHELQDCVRELITDIPEESAEVIAREYLYATETHERRPDRLKRAHAAARRAMNRAGLQCADFATVD